MNAMGAEAAQCSGPEASTVGSGMSTVSIVVTTLLAAIPLLTFLRTFLNPLRPSVLPSPLMAVQRMDVKEKAALPYKVDHFPGARDVITPYGSIRVYEWGPEDGRKVLLVHGISTTCMTLTHIANGLVARGCRVIMFDLFGRGFSDGVGDLPHDARLYVTEMLCALASSPLSWTGADQMSLVGYSLGGGIAIHFANAFPHLVSHLFLLAPAGLIRAKNFGTLTRIVFQGGVVPDRLLAVLTARRLQNPIASSKVKAEKAAAETAAKRAADLALEAEKAAEQYVDIGLAETTDKIDSLEREREGSPPVENRVLEYVRWMVIHHRGFVPAFMSCIRHAPLTEQHEAWKGLRNRKKGRTAILLARSDELIDAHHYEEDAAPLLGEKGREDIVWKVLPGGHDFVMTHPEEILREVDAVWDGESS